MGEIIQTNLARLTATNPLATAAAKAAPKPKRSLLQRLTALFAGDTSGKTKAEKRLPEADRQALGLATPELLENLLAERVEVSDNQLRELMTARARWAQDWLVQTGHVSADRVFLAAPKSLEASYQAASRVSLSLESPEQTSDRDLDRALNVPF